MVKSFWECQNMMKSLYEDCIKSVCIEFGLASIELDILMFLHDNPDCCTATDIVNIRKLTKSHVSAALKELNEHGYIEKEFKKGNRKTIYLKVTEEAADVIAKGKGAQENFARIMFNGVSDEDKRMMRNNHEKIADNIKEYFRMKEK